MLKKDDQNLNSASSKLLPKVSVQPKPELIVYTEKKSTTLIKTKQEIVQKQHSKKKEKEVSNVSKKQIHEKKTKPEQQKKDHKATIITKDEYLVSSEIDQKHQFSTNQKINHTSNKHQNESVQKTKSSDNTCTSQEDYVFQSSIVVRDSSNQSGGSSSTNEESKYPILIKQQSQNYQNLLLKLREKNVLIIKEDQITNSFQCIGKGAFGVVFKGRWMNLDVAIKEIVVSYEEIGIMLSELEFLSKCRYPQIISFYGLSIKELTMGNTVQCQLIMELMKTDLDSLIFKGEHNRNLKVLVKILHQITSAVQFLHKSEIVHRDIKPQNILIDHQMNAKLSDLGIAKVLENKVQTQNATIAFTMCYASPETALEEITSFKSDIWSLGILFYEVLTGRRAWEQINKKSKIIVALSTKQSPFVQNWEDLIQQNELVNLINKTVNYNPDQRYTADQVYESINQINIKLQ